MCICLVLYIYIFPIYINNQVVNRRKQVEINIFFIEKREKRV